MNPVPLLKRRPVPDACQALEAAGMLPVLARIYAARGITRIDETEYVFSALPHFSLLKNSDATATRLFQAIQNQEKIVVVADYDVDGATACAVALRGLSALGATVDFIVPNRFEHGYGLTPEVLAAALPLAPQLLLTVDNGIASIAAARVARAAGIDLIVTDHHLPAAELPDTPYIINPNQPGCPFPSKNLAGVGVMFYVLLATRAKLREHFPDREAPNLAELLDYVALGTVADVVPLDHPNRILIAQGLRRMRAGTAHAGIAALFSVSGRASECATTYDLGFALGPRLNAAGRLADMSVGVRCLISDDAAQALHLASELDALNRERRVVESDIQREALDEINQTTFNIDDHYTISVARPEWHTGVIGIVASRLREKFNRPAIVFGSNDDSPDSGECEMRGSGRSIPGLHLRDTLDRMSKRSPNLLLKFGGHAMAAGLTLRASDFETFASLFETVVRESLAPEQLQRMVETDGALPPEAMNLDLAVLLRDLVWGQNFPAPLFDDTFCVVRQNTLKDKHSRLLLKLGTQYFNAILFGDITVLPPEIHAAYRLEANTYQGLTSLQLVIEQWWETKTYKSL